MTESKSPSSRPHVLRVPATALWAKIFTPPTTDRTHQMSMESLFLLSAILAPMLITIYSLQHLMLRKEPTLMAPDWQNWAVKWRAICCLPREHAGCVSV